MLGIMFRKLWSKKWMFLCLLLGSVLLIATVVSFPLYRNAAYDSMLRDGFENSLRETGQWPGKLRMTVASQRGKKGEQLYRAEEFMGNVESLLGVETKESIYFYRLNKLSLNSLMNRADPEEVSLCLGYMSDLPEHVTLRSGEMYSEDGYAEDGSIEVVINESCMIDANLLVGDTLEFFSLKDADGNLIRLKVVGVFQSNENDYYWEIGTSVLAETCLMQGDLFRELFLGEAVDDVNIVCLYCYLFEYDSLRAVQVDKMMETIAMEDFAGNIFSPLLESFVKRRERISATLMILQAPVLVLLGAFLFMISGQMYELEKNEISVIKSRGSSGFQIFRLYLYQSIFITAVGVILGIPLGVAFCRILGSARNFLEFGLRRSIVITFDGNVWDYLVKAAAVTLLIMTLPAIPRSRVSIVHLKQKKSSGKRSWWGRSILCVICLAVGWYVYNAYSRNLEYLILSMLSGQPLDPLLYLGSSLLIVGAGLLFLILQPLFVRMVYLIGRRFWHPASYASFMEILKNGGKQQFIMLFLILTVSLGIYNATVARTILQNAQANTEYLDGTDIVIQELWGDNSAYKDADEEFQYIEPNYGKYGLLEGVENYTRVLFDSDVYIAAANNMVQYVTLMGIHTKEFGEITWLDRDLLGDHYYNYLNALAQEPSGILVSSNFQDMGYTLGSRVSYSHYREMPVYGTIVGFVDYWPGFASTSMRLDGRGEAHVENNYLIVANLAECQKNFGLQPYQVWIGLKEGVDSQSVAAWINENGVRVQKYVDRQKDVQDTVEDPLLQGTNGVLTMGFLVMILLCGVGYLIYWIMSIRSREMIFGVLRAFGMHKGELFHMLILEQIFCGVLSVLGGIFIGKQVSDLFVPLLLLAYAADNQVLPMQLYTQASDMQRLYGALGLVMAVCLSVLIFLVLKLNVAKALKLGEE